MSENKDFTWWDKAQKQDQDQDSQAQKQWEGMRQLDEQIKNAFKNEGYLNISYSYKIPRRQGTFFKKGTESKNIVNFGYLDLNHVWCVAHKDGTRTCELTFNNKGKKVEDEENENWYIYVKKDLIIFKGWEIRCIDRISAQSLFNLAKKLNSTFQPSINSIKKALDPRNDVRLYDVTIVECGCLW